MKWSLAALALLLSASALVARDATRQPGSLRFLLIVPSNIPLEEVRIQYFAYRGQGGYERFLKPLPKLNGYELMVTGTQVKVVAYLPGCQFDTLVLTPGMPTSQMLDCRPLRSVELRGQIEPRSVLADKAAFVEASYLARWACGFFGIADCLVPAFRVATATPSDDGSFKMALPDFADDPVPARWKLKGGWQFLLREAKTWNILAELKAKGSLSRQDGLEVRSSYPEIVVFKAAPN